MLQPRNESQRRRILLIEDDQDLCSLVQDYLTQNKFECEAAQDGRQGLARALEGFDQVILDVMLPVLDGFEVLRQFRNRSATPVIMLTARTSAAIALRASTPTQTIISPSLLILRNCWRASARFCAVRAAAKRLRPRSRPAACG